jgi:hypothetical protein
MSPALGLLLASLISPVLGYVLPADRVVAELEEKRAKQVPLRIEAELSGVTLAWPTEVVFEIHPEYGFRVSDDQGGRWLIRRGVVVAGTREPAPPWIPELEILSLQASDDLRAWFRRAQVDLGRNELVRCGDLDCFVLGGKSGRSQVWIDKDSFDVERWTSGSGRTVGFLSYTSWDGLRFPGIIELRDRKGVFATLVIHAVRSANRLKPGDFSPAWVESAPASPED